MARYIGRGWARLTYATRVEPTWLEVNRHEVAIQGLPDEFAGLRIVQLSDLHSSQHVTPEYLREAVDLAQAQHGDVVVLTGDFVHKGFTHVDRVARVVGRLHAPQGVYAVLGNHDFSVRNALGIRRYPHLHRAIADALTDQGVRVLRNETVRLARGDGALHLTGVEDLWSRVCDLDQAFDGVCPSVPRVVLAHNPCTVERLAQHRCDLMLSGHTHGGQVKLPGLGPLALGPKGRRYAAGMYRCGDTHLYVNKGVGFGLRLRYNVRPEVAVFTLRPAPASPSAGTPAT
ncbi:MAG: metallophosphoesterase [Gemmataceae bacterium]|nr:metallophosphoesterase [Gemmataceae bacterium]